MKRADRVDGTERGTVAQVLSYARSRSADRPGFLSAYLDELLRLCLANDFDFSILVAQSANETDSWTSPAWNTYGNPAGIGITNSQNLSLTYATGEDAARAHVVHFYVYSRGAIPSSTELYEYIPLDPRYDAALAAFPNTIDTIDDFNVNGRWALLAAPPWYGDRIIVSGNAIFPGLEQTPAGGTTPMPTGLSFGNVEHPPYRDRLILDSQTRKYDNLGQRKPVGVCQHSMIGTLQGSDNYFRQNTALTDYGIGNSTDGPLDGVIFRWNDPTGAPHPNYTIDGKTGNVSANRAGWANGGSDGLEGDGIAYVRKLGVNAINRDLVSIERSDGGQIGTPISNKQMVSICALTAHWFDRMQVPWDTFPLNPHVDLVTHLWHKEFATKDCPFPAVYSRVAEIQDRIRAILKAGQTQTKPTDPVPPVDPNPVPDKEWPNGWQTDELARQFGVLPRHNPDGTVDNARFDEDGIISNSWVARANERGITKVEDIPPPLIWHRIEDTDKLRIDQVTFDGKGSDNWLLFRPAAEVAWKWLEIG